MDECEPKIYALCVRVGTFDGVGVHRAVMAPTRAFDDYVRAGDELSPPPQRANSLSDANYPICNMFLRPCRLSARAK
jgi:hypothetical protein